MMVFCYLFDIIRRLLSVFRQESVTNTVLSPNSADLAQINTVAVIPLRNRNPFHRLPPEIRMLIWTLCIENESSWDGNEESRRPNSHRSWGIMYAFSSERVFMNEILRLFYRSTAFELTEIYGIKIARSEPSNHLEVNLAIVISPSRIIPMCIRDTRYPHYRGLDAFDIFFDELRRYLAMTIAKRQYLSNEVRNAMDVEKTVCTMSLRFERTLDVLDLHFLRQLADMFEDLEEIDVTYLFSDLRDPSVFHRVRFELFAETELSPPVTNTIFGPKWILVRTGVVPYSLQIRRIFWTASGHWHRNDRISQPAHGNSARSSSSWELHPLDHLGLLARLADLSTVRDQ
ncbi:hypothetical protein NHQ30_009914 [Ciborinia camelliae]|nr:hypothetical protein NHQ30_009914 [Ciborinia camelliae]